MRSRLPLLTFVTDCPALTFPEYTLMKTTLPTKGSVITLNARADRGCSSSGYLNSISSVFGSVPSTGGTSNGDGRYSNIASSNGCMPLPRRAVPHSTGTTCCCMAVSYTHLTLPTSDLV